MGEPGGLPSMGSHRVGRDLAAAAGSVAPPTEAQAWAANAGLEECLIPSMVRGTVYPG